jgi:hypothetical protein
MVNEKESSPVTAPKGMSTIFDNLLFPKIFQTFRIAIHWKTLAIAFLAVTVICFVGWIMDRIVVAASGPEVGSGVFSKLWHIAIQSFNGAVLSLFEFKILSVAENIAYYFKATGSTFRDHYIYCIIFCVVKLVVISICGGAICRIAALQFARGEKPGLTEALRFSIKKFTSFLTAPLAPVIIIIFMGVFIFLLGLIGNIPWLGELIMGILMFLALIIGAMITVVLIGTIAGFNLMFPAVACDGSDCFDAISRSFSYVYSKPWQMGFYTAVAAVYGAICYMFVRFFALLLLSATHLLLQFGIIGDNSKLTVIWTGPSFWNLLGPSSVTAAHWTQSFAAFMVHLCLLAVIGLVVAFVISFYFSANTIIYALMRNRVDNTALDDIYTLTEVGKTETEFKPQEDTDEDTINA